MCDELFTDCNGIIVRKRGCEEHFDEKLNLVIRRATAYFVLSTQYWQAAAFFLVGFEEMRDMLRECFIHYRARPYSILVGEGLKPARFTKKTFTIAKQAIEGLGRLGW